MSVELIFESDIHTTELETGIGVATPDNVILFSSSSSDQGALFEIHPGSYRVAVSIDPNHLKPGRYHLALGLTAGALRDYIPEAWSFEILDSAAYSRSPMMSRPGYLLFPFLWDEPETVDA